MTYGSGRSLLGGGGPVVQAVRGVSLTIRRGTTLGLVGESGSGKSTLGRCATLLARPTAGDVLFKGESLVSADRRRLTALRRGFQTVFQDPYSSLNPRKTVARLIREPLDIHGSGNPASRVARVAEMMQLVGLREDQGSRFPHEFSGGQRQRIAIARALVLEPELLVLDEPTSALDVSVQAQIVNLLLRLQADLGLTYFFISHNLHLVRHISDDVAVMYKGQIVETGPSAQFFANPRHDYTQQLIASAV
nr:ATP-binding cassette domain-containing protein [Chelatococcus asaccharovorans]